MEDTNKTKQNCTCCGKLKKIDDYYASSSPFHKLTSKLHVCKQCIWDRVGDDVTNLPLIKETLRMLDKPFLLDLWQSSIEEGMKGGKNTFKLYMKNLGLSHNRELTWSDTDILNMTNQSNESSFSSEVDEDLIENEETFRYWGNGYTLAEYSFLEEERHKLMSSFECPDYGMEMIMKDICFINLDIEKARQERKENTSKTITNLIKTRSDLMNDANMKPIQSTGAEANDQVTFGTLIKKWETERPIPRPVDDEMKEYIDTFMIGHLAKMEGLNNEMTEKYDRALTSHTINFEEINKVNEEYED